MNMLDITQHRLYQQQISRQAQGLPGPGEIVAWLGAVQAQDYLGALWALGVRLPGSSDNQIEQAFNEGVILRTHVMRPTWHFVTSADIGWMLELTGPRIQAGNAGRYRDLGLDEQTFRRAHTVLEKALRDGHYLTRDELGALFAQAGIEARGQRLAYLVMQAELDRVICSGGRRGKQFTYALLDERVPQGRSLAREEALAELARRYFTSHGPALLRDFAWWSGLTLTDARAGLELLGDQLVQEEINGQTYWYAPVELPPPDPSLSVYLLPPFDEYGIAYQDHSPSLDASFAEQANTNSFGGTIVIDGQGVGYWRRTLKKKTVIVRPEPFRPLSAPEQAGVAAAARKYGDFLGLETQVQAV